MDPSSRRLLLFDIDGTLLLTGGAGMRCMARAGKDVFGPSLTWDGMELSGGLDPALLAEAATRCGVSIGPGAEEAFRRRYVELLAVELGPPYDGVRAMPGVVDLLVALRIRGDAVLGLLTGNYPEGAAIKLRAAGIDPAWFVVTAFGDEAATRPALVALALRKWEALEGRPVDPARAIVIGDSPRDVEAALANGCLAVAVGTGKYDHERLRAIGAHRAARDLADPTPLTQMLS
jgi:phosphoglycolate phosphatase-like HAD superfamily hydrolase